MLRALDAAGVQREENPELQIKIPLLSGKAALSWADINPAIAEVIQALVEAGKITLLDN